MNPESISPIFTKLFPNDILSSQEINKLQLGGKIISFNKKNVVFRQGTLISHVMFLESGMVKLFKEGKNERSIILKISTPGDLIGFVSIYGDSVLHDSATAIEDSSVFFIDINTFNSVIENNGKYGIYLLKKVCKDNLNIFERITSQYHKQLPGKIADIILYFSEQIYQSDIFEFPLTRTELAALAGTTKESFIRTLTEFKNDKIIEIDGKLIKIKSIDIIKTLSRLG